MRENRRGRVDEEVRREIGAILQQKARDPRLRWVSVTRVEVSRDLSVAQVFISTLGDDSAKDDVLEALVKAGPFVRSELGRSLRLRRTPELRFHYDLGVEHSLRVSQLLDEMGATGGLPDPATEGEPDEENATETAEHDEGEPDEEDATETAEHDEGGGRADRNIAGGTGRDAGSDAGRATGRDAGNHTGRDAGSDAGSGPRGGGRE